MKFEELSEQVYEDLNGYINAVIKKERTYQVIFECDDWLNPAQRRRFILEFENVAEFHITPGDCGAMYTTTDHPLLWDHNEVHDSIYFSSSPDNPAEFLGLLYSAHCSLLKDWRPFNRYVYVNLSSLQRGDGLLAEGPRDACAIRSSASTHRGAVIRSCSLKGTTLFVGRFP